MGNYVLGDFEADTTVFYFLTCCLSSHHSYSTRDGLMGLSRIAVAASLVFSYPLAFVGARDGVLELFSVKNRSNGVLNTLTVGMLSAITIAALLIPDVSFVLAFAGCVSMEYRNLNVLKNVVPMC